VGRESDRALKARQRLRSSNIHVAQDINNELLRTLVKLISSPTSVGHNTLATDLPREACHTPLLNLVQLMQHVKAS